MLNIPSKEEINEELKNLIKKLCLEVAEELKTKQKPYLRIDEVLETVGIGKTTLMKWFKDGLEYIQVDGIKLVKYTELEKFLERYKR